jgi:hypothetical protein
MRLPISGKLLPCVTALGIFAVALPASATLFYHETFSYPDGDLTTQSGGNWTAHSGAGAKPIQVSGGQITLQQSSGSGEDVNRLTGATMVAGDTWYSAFDVSINELTPGAGIGRDYFAHFKDAGFFFGARLWTDAGSSGGYRLALSGDSSITDLDGEAYWPNELAFGTTYRVVTSYDYDSGVAQMWIDPATEASASITATDGFGGDEFITYAFRQASPSPGSTQTIDNLCVATSFNEALNCIPEPSTAALVLLAFGLAGIGRRAVRC